MPAEKQIISQDVSQQDRIKELNIQDERLRGDIGELDKQIDNGDNSDAIIAGVGNLIAERFEICEELKELGVKF